jgi:hypothetical protein
MYSGDLAFQNLHTVLLFKLLQFLQERIIGIDYGLMVSSVGYTQQHSAVALVCKYGYCCCRP